MTMVVLIVVVRSGSSSLRGSGACSDIQKQL